MAIFTAIAGMMNPLSPEWDEVYKRRLFIEMRLNIETERYEQTTKEKGTEETSTSGTGWICFYGDGEECYKQALETAVSDNQNSTVAAEAEGNESEGINEQKTMEEVQTGADTISAGAEAVEERTVVWAEERMAVSESQAEDEIPGEGTAGTAVDVTGEQPVTSTEIHSTNPGTQQVEVRPDTVSVGIPGAPLYQIDGDTLDHGVAEYLYRRLCEAGIGWFYEFSVCLAYQESSFNPLAENPNGLDKGLFQFRVEYHPGLDWRNPYQQVNLFVQMMATRAAAGCDPYMMVSRHNTSDYCPEFNEVYVAQVLQHLPKLRRVK